MRASACRRSFASGFSVAGVVTLFGGFYFKFYWNEGIDLDLGSFAANTQHFMTPTSFGVSTLLGVPVFDFASGVGYRYPINHGLPLSGFALLRHVLPAELTLLIVLLLALGISLTSVNLALHTIGQNRLPVLLATNFVLSQPIFFLLINYDFYFNAIGYCALVSGVGLICIKFSPLGILLSRQRLFFGLLGLFIGITTGSQWLLLAIWPLAILCAREVANVVRLLASSRSGLKLLLLAACGATSGLGYIAVQIASVDKPPRAGTVSFLRSAFDGSSRAGISFVCQAITRDVPGLAYLFDLSADTNIVESCYAGHFKVPSGIVVILILTLVSTLSNRINQRTLLVCWFSLVIAVFLSFQSSDFIPIGVSWRDAYLLVPFIFSTILLAQNVGDARRSTAENQLQRVVPVVLGLLLFVSAGTSVLFAAQNRTMGFTTLSPTENGALTSIIRQPTERFESLLEESGHKKGYRLLSVTDNFRNEVFDGELIKYYGMFGWSDLRESGFPVVSHAHKFQGSAVLRIQPFFPSGFTELSLDGLASRSNCQLSEFEFLSVFSVMSDESFRDTCRNPDWISTPLLDPESQLSGPVYINRPRSFHWFGAESSTDETCPFLTDACVTQLKLETLKETGRPSPPLFIPESGENKAIYRLPADLSTGPRLLVLPIAYDSSIQISSAETNEKVTGTAFAGYISIERSSLQHLAGTDLLFKTTPDAEMIYVALLPWFWLIIVTLLLYSGIKFVASREDSRDSRP